MINLANKVHINAYPFEGEHLVSLMARHHLYSGFKRYKASVGTISQDYTKQTPLEIVRPLYRDVYDAFSPTMGYKEFLSKFTLYPYYESFLPDPDRQIRSSETLIADRIHKVNFASEWRHCSSCAEEDLDTVGVTFYNIRHQLPGMTVCLKHNQPLMMSCKKCQGNRRYLDKIGMPHPTHCPSCKSSYESIEGYMDEDIHWLLTTSEQLLSSEAKSFNLAHLQKQYRNYLGLQAEGVRHTVSDQKRIIEVQNALNEYFSMDLYRQLFTSNSSNRRYRFTGMPINLMAFNQKAFLPLSHLLVIRMLFGELKNVPK